MADVTDSDASEKPSLIVTLIRKADEMNPE
jgi:hypothetical protein